MAGEAGLVPGAAGLLAFEAAEQRHREEGGEQRGEERQQDDTAAGTHGAD